MNQIAAPEKNIIVVSVTMKAGMPKRVMQAPFRTPISPPTARKARTPAGTVTSGRRRPAGRRSLVMTTAPTTLAMARIEGAERSMPATIRTKVWPMATTRSGIIAARMSRQVSAVSDLRHERRTWRAK